MVAGVSVIRSEAEVIESLFQHAVSEGLLDSTDYRTGRYGIQFGIFATEMVTWQTFHDYLQRESFLSTAIEEDNIRRHAQPFYSSISAKPCYNTVKIYWTIPFVNREQISIPGNYTIETLGQNPIQYLTLQNVTIYPEQDYIFVPVISRNAGKDNYVSSEQLVMLNSKIAGLSVTNLEASYGGRDEETITSVTDNALRARFTLEKGTSDAIDLELARQGLEYYQFNKVNAAFGGGSGAIYIDTTSNDYIKMIKEALQHTSAFGISLIVEQAIEILLDLSLTVRLYNIGDLTPNQRDNLISEINDNFKEYVLESGVGQKILMTKAIFYLFQHVSSTYAMAEVHIEPTNILDRKDEYGNILLDSNEVARINKLDITIEVVD